MDELISRQDAIKAVKHAWAKGLEPSQYEDYEFCPHCGARMDL